MQPKNLRDTIQKIINKEKWWDILSRFIDVLHVNIFIVDSEGRIILPPEEGKYGGSFLTDTSLAYGWTVNTSQIIQKFKPSGSYYEYASPSGAHSFAIPINIDHDQTIAYMIVGPVILIKKLEWTKYEEIAKEYKINYDVLISQISEIRVMSNVMVNSILDLLAEIIKDNVELSKKDKYVKASDEKSALAQEINKVAQEIYSTVRLDELLVTLLDVALKMTETECGSIMVLDEKNKNLSVKVSRGMTNQKAVETKGRLGEGIAGIAAKNNTSFVINGQQQVDNRIKHLLKRPEIKQSLIMPLTAKDKVIGVLNLHTKKDESKIQDNFDNLQYLTKLLSSVF